MLLLSISLSLVVPFLILLPGFSGRDPFVSAVPLHLAQGYAEGVPHNDVDPVISPFISVRYGGPCLS